MKLSKLKIPVNDIDFRKKGQTVHCIAGIHVDINKMNIKKTMIRK